MNGRDSMPTTLNDQLLFDRIQYLLNPDIFAEMKVTIVGLGSGGAPICDNLTMNGIKKWDLFDPDKLDPVNLIKHPRRRADLGRLKVDIQKEWILDRNPTAKVNAFAEDVMQSDNFINSVANSSLVLSCPDKKSVREYVSDICVKNNIPFVTASVFRTGIGGEIFAYIPGETGCYKCLQIYSFNNKLNLTEEDLGLTQEEENNIYGLNDTNFKASGLSIDIQMVSLIQSRMALSLLLKNTDNNSFPRLKSNWIIWGNRPAKNIFKKHFESSQFLLKPQLDCYCNKKNMN